MITPGALEEMRSYEIQPFTLLRRHQAGDWGEVCPEDRWANDVALVDGGRLLSVYHLYDITFWVITEADRSATTILLPGEY